MSPLPLLLRAIGAAFALPLMAAPAPPPVGSVIALRNQATIASPPGASAGAKMKMPVHSGDVISTGADSAIRVQLADQTFFSLGAQGRVTIDRFVYDTSRNASSMSLSFARGAFRFVSGKPTHANPGQPAIRTPVGVIGIRGTVVTGIIGPEALAYYRQIDPALAQDTGEAETATLILLSDPGEQGGGIDVDATTGITELRTAGQAIFFRRRGERPQPPRMLPPEFRGQIERRAAPERLGREPGGQQQPAQRGGQGSQQGQGGQGPQGQGGQGARGPQGGGAGPGGSPGGAPGGGPPR